MYSEWKQQTRFTHFIGLLLFLLLMLWKKFNFFIVSSLIYSRNRKSFRLSNFSFWAVNSFIWHRHLNCSLITDLYASKWLECNWHCIQVIENKKKPWKKKKKRIFSSDETCFVDEGHSIIIITVNISDKHQKQKKNVSRINLIIR